MSVFTVQHPEEKNVLGSGVMIRTFQDGQNIDALWLVRADNQSVITDAQMYKVAEGLTRALNDLPSEGSSVKTNGTMLHFSHQPGQDVMYLTERHPEKSQSPEGSVSVPTLEFRIRPELSNESKAFVIERLSTPGVLKRWLDSIDMTPNEKQHQRPQATPPRGMTPS